MAKELLQKEEYDMLSFLGVNRHIKRGWRTLPRAFGGVGLLSFSLEQTICWLNMLIQHFGVPTVLGNKFSASLEALQLEIETLGNPLVDTLLKVPLPGDTFLVKVLLGETLVLQISNLSGLSNATIASRE